MSHIVYIGIGSNLGDRLTNCNKAIEFLNRNNNCQVSAVSPWYETQALTLDNEPQPPYLNGVAKIQTTLEPKYLWAILKGIEMKMGRPISYRKWSPRPMDLDILFYDDLIFSDSGIIIPHPELEKRMFVLKPLCDIEPQLIHPVKGKKICELYQELI